MRSRGISLPRCVVALDVLLAAAGARERQLLVQVRDGVEERRSVRLVGVGPGVHVRREDLHRAAQVYRVGSAGASGREVGGARLVARVDARYPRAMSGPAGSRALPGISQRLHERLAGEPTIRWAYLFGSAARGETFRDLDVAVMLTDDAPGPLPLGTRSISSAT